MGIERRLAPLLVLAACAPPSPYGTARVAVALSPTPADVKTVSVFVVQLDRDLSVASATTSADNATFDLEVPAETALDFRALARTGKPGPPAIGPMPAYFGSSVQTIALGSKEVEVGLTVHRAGVLTMATKAGAGVSTDDLAVALEEESAVAPHSIVFGADVLPESFVLRAGRHHVRITSPDDRMRVLRGRSGLYVAPETESVAILDVETSTGALDPALPRSLLLTLVDDRSAPLQPPDLIRTSTARPTRISLRVEALDAGGLSVADPQAKVQLSLASQPAAVATGRTSATANGIPATIDGILFEGVGRFRLRGSAVLNDGRTIVGRLDGNALRPEIVPSIPRRVELRVEDPDSLAAGTMMEIALIDARGLFAQAGSGAIDLSTSDPWAYFPDGLGGTISPTARGHALRRISRPSGPRGTGVVVRATLTSTAIPDVLTATLALPRLELP